MILNCFVCWLMGLIKLVSSSPHFSFLIYKNPERGLIVKPHRQGLFYCFYPKKAVQEYLIYFRDKFNQVSYKSNPNCQFEYLDILRYTSPEIPLQILRECLRSTYTRQHEHDVETEHNHSFTVYAVKIDRLSSLDRFTRYFTSFQVEYTPLVGAVYRVTISSKTSLFRLLNFVNIFFLFIVAQNTDYYQFHQSQLENIVRSINILDADYYIRYLINSRFITSREVFHSLKSELESSQTLKIEMKYGNTAEQRRNEIQTLLSFSRNIVDIGCGEGFYAIPFAKRLKSKEYYALDVDKTVLSSLNAKREKNGLTNIHIYHSLEKLLKDLDQEATHDVIITEVVEHMTREEGQSLIQKVIEEVKWEKIIITTPNYSFNKFYLMDRPYRHDDHKWEATREEFQIYIEEILQSLKTESDYPIQYIGIGDHVDGMPVTQAACLVRSQSKQ